MEEQNNLENPVEVFDKGQAIKLAQEFLTRFKDEGKTINEVNKKAMVGLANEFRDESSFTYARRLFQVLHQKFPEDKKVVRALAVCTYKDDDLSSDKKYKIAEQLLKDNFGEGENKEITNPKVLGVLGSIYKKKWKYENHDGHLFLALRYYKQGYDLALANDDLSNYGFCGVNLAFVYNLLAGLDSHQLPKKKNGLIHDEASNPFNETAEVYNQRARGIRRLLCQKYEEDFAVLQETLKTDTERKESFEKYEHFWYFVTWAEVLMGRGLDEGLDCFKLATDKFREAVKLNNTPFWKRHSASVQGFQLVELLYCDNDLDKEKAKKGLKVLLGVDYVPDNHTDKIGLALSGGGFRASIFHIGVLAKLAEADLLRKVEVISCVSGGSILGAFYYLKLKQVLETDPGKDENGNQKKLGKQDYIDLVAEVEKEFLEGINKNVRINILSNPLSNLKMFFTKGYTRSKRTADLYDKFFYNQFIDKKGKGGRREDDGKRDYSKVYMHDLLIHPFGKENFRPDRDNWKEDNKVPILILNAATLNTGHSWQFTASWMGESPAYINSEFDSLPNLRRMYYVEAPGKYQENIPLSIAVAASAGVPGLFAPIEMDNLYRDEVKLSLVDGGVHDNQGLSTLYEQECNRIIVSDASGQMSESPRPASNMVSVSLRTNGILQERIRYSQFRDLEARKNSGVIRDYLLMHFTKSLPGDVISWKHCDDPYIRPHTDAVDLEDDDSTDYNIRIGIQKKLAKIRTDLDAFHPTESAALMYSGYRMTAREIETASSDVFNTDIVVSDKWNFAKLQKIHDSDDLYIELDRKLTPSSQLFNKSFALSKIGRWWKKRGRIVLGFIAVGLLFYFADSIWKELLDFDYKKNLYDPVVKTRNLIGLLILLAMIPIFALLMKGINLVSNYFYIRLGKIPEAGEEE